MSKPRYPDALEVTVRPPKRGVPEGNCRIAPCDGRVAYGGTVTFKAANGCGPLVVWVPTRKGGRKLFPKVRGSHFGVKVTKSIRVLGKEHKTGHPRVYPYAVYCQAHNRFAVGSLPRMIVGP